jgi:hypothetical protein
VSPHQPNVPDREENIVRLDNLDIVSADLETSDQEDDPLLVQISEFLDMKSLATTPSDISDVKQPTTTSQPQPGVIHALQPMEVGKVRGPSSSTVHKRGRTKRGRIFLPDGTFVRMNSKKMALLKEVPTLGNKV